WDWARGWLWVRFRGSVARRGNRPSGFSIGAVHSEQWRPPMRARIFRRLAVAEVSSLHGLKAEAVCVATLIAFSISRLASRSHWARRFSGRFRLPLRG